MANSASPHDSLSPLDEHLLDDIKEAQQNVVQGTSEAYQQQSSNITFRVTAPDGTTDDVAPAQWSPQDEACLPRSAASTFLISRPHRPPQLHLHRSNGLTSIGISELKQAICDARGDPDESAPVAQQAREKPKRRQPKTPVLTPMGNSPSKVLGLSQPSACDDASIHSLARTKPAHMSRKSSSNLFKRMDSKSPLPRPITATTIVVTQRGSAYTTDDSEDPYVEPAHAVQDSVVMAPPASAASTVTITEDRVGRPLSTSSTIQEERRLRTRSLSQSATEESEDDEDVTDMQAISRQRSSALSPTLPAPSPLPEDSPHKYGLKDHMDTPERVPPPEEAGEKQMNAARSRSSGVEIFNEAKSLQSASSFLNGLSTSRRRADSLNRVSNNHTAITTSLRAPSSTTTANRIASHNDPSTGNTSTYNLDLDCRRRGHNFKSNGFAFSRPLQATQHNCFSKHSCLIISNNNSAPVECAVCHMDDDQEHWTCSWCALRMCRYCRADFLERGMAALRERIRKAEMGEAGEADDSLGGLAGRSRMEVLLCDDVIR